MIVEGGRCGQMARYLVVANQTLGGEQLIETIRESTSRGEVSEFYVIVPATPPDEQLVFTEGKAQAIAQRRLDRALARFRELGAVADGAVGDGNPLLAIEDALRDQSFDEIILSTLPPGPSRWLKLDLPNRVQTHFDLPVRHVVGEPEPANLKTEEPGGA
jgi:hypothetical protein